MSSHLEQVLVPLLHDLDIRSDDEGRTQVLGHTVMQSAYLAEEDAANALHRLPQPHAVCQDATAGERRRIARRWVVRWPLVVDAGDEADGLGLVGQENE